MTAKGAFVGGAALGAGAAYLLDPDRGRRRRALVRDQVVRLSGKSRDALDAAARDVTNRTRGTLAELRRTIRGDDGPVTDEVLVERVRERLGHHTSHPSAIRVTAVGGLVLLEGPILASEVQTTIRGVRGVRGVRDVESRLALHPTPEGVPALQGGSERGAAPGRLLRTPTGRLLAGAALAALAAASVVRARA